MNKHDIARHEIAHAAAAAIEAARIKAYSAVVHIACLRAPNAKGQAGTFYAESRDAALSKRLMGAAAYGPVALLPEQLLREAIRNGKGLTDTLSEEDLRAAEHYHENYGHPAALIPATWALLQTTGKERLSRMASILIVEEAISISIRDLFPLKRVLQSIEKAPHVQFNAELGRHLATQCTELQA
jgi:hypothetical protein